MAIDVIGRIFTRDHAGSIATDGHHQFHFMMQITGCGRVGLCATARQHGVDLYYEAAVGGAIPIIRPLRESLAGDQLRRVVGIVNAFPEVAHNYERDHALNMWFVVATPTPEGIDDAIARIEAATRLPVLAFPKEREYFVELRLTA